ncbi:MAG: SDR family oxidoreductase [Bacteroidia bacterium]|nr:MAG: SDR family oxidoreductase [Bacteroidia bacterium]
MGFLSGKKILITGLISDRSIAYGVAKVCKREGALLAFTYQGEKIEQRVKNLAAEFDSTLVLPCDVAQDEQIPALFEKLGQNWDGLDGILHSIAFSPKAGLTGDFVENVDREVFRIANDVTAYSFTALAKYAKPLLQKNNGSLVTLTYLGAEKVVPNYNMAGVAKAALEATMRYMAYSLGKDGIRVNAVSAGPIKTLAASGIAGFSKILDHVEKTSPLHKNITTEEVGNAVAFLLSHLASGITGEVLYVDAGYNIVVAGLD